MQLKQAIERTARRQITLCIVCEAVHYYHPQNETCSRCGREGTLIDSKTEELKLSPALLALSEKLRKLPGKPVTTQPQDLEIETMAKKAVKKVAKKKESANPIPVGKTLGLRIQDTWISLFEQNEKAPKTQKKTDEDLRKFILKEFPTVDSNLFSQLRDGVLHRIQAIRARYNRGGMTGGKAPKVQSHRYDEQGNYADPKFSGKAGVVLEQLDKRFIIPASENRRTPKKVVKPVKKAVRKKVVLKKKPVASASAVPAASAATEA